MRATFSEIIERLGGGTPSGDGYLTSCPAHDDSNPSLVVTLKDDGRVLMHCRSQNCSFIDIVAALEMQTSDFVEVEAGGDLNVSSGIANKMPPSAAHLSWLNTFIDSAHSRFFDSPAAEYAEKRWGITASQAVELRLGFTDAGIQSDYIPRPWATSPRITVPLLGFDKTPRGLQGRALQDDPTRWCSLANPPDTAWSRLGVFVHDHGDDYIQLGEGPGDALTAYAAGTSSVFLRGTSLAMGSVNQIIAGCSGKVVILAGDSDLAGQNFNNNMGEALVQASIEVRTLNLKEFGDVTEWREHNPQQFIFDFHRALRSAPAFEATVEEPEQIETRTTNYYKLTEQGNGQRLVDKMNGSLSFCPQIGRMVYVNGHWQYDELHHTERQFTELTNEMYEEGDDLVEKGTRTDNPILVDRGTRLKAWALRSQNSPIFPNSIKAADQITAIPMEKLDTHPYFLNVKNGTVDLRTGQLKEHDPDDWITHRINIDYNPDAECQRFDLFLQEIFPDEPEMPPYVNRIAGYAATGEVRESCLICSVGIGANGKSILWGTIEHVLGDLAGSVPFSAFEKRSSGASTADLAYLRGKRLAMVQEGEANTLLAESTIKRATSGSDSISARHLYKSTMKFYPEFLIIMATNSLPRIRGADEGIWRRIRLLRFKRFFEDWERDPYLFETLKAEEEGILRWIVEGAKEWYANGLRDPEAVKDSTKNYRSTADELAGFIGQVIEEDPSGSIQGSELMELYMDWCVEENVRSWSRRALYEAICERVHGAEKVKKMDGVHLLGVRKATP